MRAHSARGWIALALPLLATPATRVAADPVLEPYLADRGSGVATSMFGTYVRGHELLVYTFYELTVNHDQEYKPEELGFVDPHDYRARRTDHEGLVSLAYGLGPDLELEGESALYTSATQHKAAADPSAMPARLEEHGLGDTEGQLRWRAHRETAGSPEVFATFEVVLPLQRHRRLIGFGLTSKAPDLAPEVGLLWSFGPAR